MKKSVLITGVSGGIGEALAREFAKNGFNIIATFNSHALSNDLDSYCQECGVKLSQYKLDITKPDEVEKVFNKAFKEADYIDCVICNAGISLGEKMLCDNEDEEINRLIQTNLVGTIYCNRAASKHFLKRKYGNIVNLSSVYGVFGGSCEAVYSASKAGIIGLTKALAKEMSGCGVRVNAVAPGFVETKMTACFSEEEKKAIKEAGQMSVLKPEEVASAVFALTQKNVTGEVVII